MVCVLRYAPSNAEIRSFFGVYAPGEQLHSNQWDAVLESWGVVVCDIVEQLGMTDYPMDAMELQKVAHLSLCLQPPAKTIGSPLDRTRTETT